ncbi:ArsR/SmtB family transcription factor [Patescibacteria group bacterium]
MSMNKEGWKKLKRIVNSKRFQQDKEACNAILGSSRFKICVLLSFAPEGIGVKEIAKLTDATSSSVSHQLAVLRKHGVVSRKKNGAAAKYVLDPDRMIEIEVLLKDFFGDVAARWKNQLSVHR